VNQGIIQNRVPATAIFLSYLITWYFGWHLSVNFETIADITSWFLPAGIRVASLLLFDKKYWPVIALSEFVGIYAVNSPNSPFTSTLGEAIGTFAPILIYMACIHRYLKPRGQVRFDVIRPVTKLFLWTGLGAALTASLLVTSLHFQGQIMPGEFIITVLSFMLGDFVGILLIVPMSFVIKWGFLNFTITEFKNTLSRLDIALVTLSIIMAVLFIQQDMTYYLKMFAFIPIIIFAYRNGWLGASISIFIVNMVMVLASLLTSDTGNMLEKQLYLIAISTTGLLLGAAMSEQKTLNQTMIENNEVLLNSNKKLHDLINKNQNLAQKVVNIQEEERKNLSRELHDEIGQNITALKLHINVIKNLTKKSPVAQAINPIIDSIDNIANITYQSAYNLMHSLRPRVLDELGLEIALVDNVFEKLLNSAGIVYFPKIKGDVTELSEELTIALYRIAQESINNAAKYSKATHLWLDLEVTPSKVQLEIRDDGIGFNAESIKKKDTSFGLQGIIDRAIALGGKHRVTSDSTGTCHRVKFKNI